MQDRINSRLQYPDNIKDLTVCCQKISNQMLATDWTQSVAKLANIKVANIFIRFIPLTKFVLPSSQQI